MYVAFLQCEIFFGGSNFFLGAIYLGRLVVPSTKIVINLPWTYEKENLINSVVSKILWYKQTNTQIHKQTNRHPVTLV